MPELGGSADAQATVAVSDTESTVSATAYPTEIATPTEFLSTSASASTTFSIGPDICYDQDTESIYTCGDPIPSTTGSLPTTTLTSSSTSIVYITETITPAPGYGFPFVVASSSATSTATSNPSTSGPPTTTTTPTPVSDSAVPTSVGDSTASDTSFSTLTSIPSISFSFPAFGAITPVVSVPSPLNATTDSSATSTTDPALAGAEAPSTFGETSSSTFSTVVSSAFASATPSVANTEARYAFNSTASDNVAVYYGATSNTTVSALTSLCSNPSVDIVILAFVSTFFTPTGGPTASFGPGCYSSTPSQQLHMPGLQNCTALSPAISACQAAGKKVLVSLGGYGAASTFPTQASAIQFASNLWSLFGAGTALDPTLRPFGDTVVDGFDLDNESNDPAFYADFAAALRAQFANDNSKPYYLSAAPQCPFPDASIPLDALALTDWVFVQFYDNPQCNLDTDGFQASFANWSAEIAAVSEATRVFVGAPAWPWAEGIGYVEGPLLPTRIGLVDELGVGNFGGVMLWDGSNALLNVDAEGDDYLVWAKTSLDT
ncbi:hypothetical protein M8818_003390 [Zalaria obscura]|uniref:Uncharacterized protein n=1 Tax=Zalaria obscura TaxID=2024903 RepID=A0ACC3SFV8_9PEZI